MRVPRDIETKLRKELGEVVPHMSIVDIAVREIFNNHTDGEIEKISKRYEHSRLAISHLQKDTTKRLVFLSQLAFIASKADAFCDDVREFIKEHSTTSLSPNLEGIDNLRKAIYLLEATKSNSDKLPNKDDESIYLKYVDCVDLAVVDYYRKIRNIQLHGGLVHSETHPTIANDDTAAKIRRKYNYKPNHLNNLTTRDAILFSRSWQAIAVSVCRKLVDINVVVKELCARHSRLTQRRKNNAITNALRQDYLQTDDEIAKLKQSTDDWLA